MRARLNTTPPTPRRSLRVLVVSDSILNMPNLREQLAALSGVPLSAISVLRRSYGGSSSPAGLAQLATDVAVYGQRGNLLRRTDVALWPTSNCVTTNVAHPSFGMPVTQLAVTANGGNVGGTIGSGTHATVPTGAPPMTFSVDVTRGTFTQYMIRIFNATTVGTVRAAAFNADYLATLPADMPIRLCVTALPGDGVGYVAGNNISCQIYPGNNSETGVSWVARPLLNVGHVPLYFAARTGTAETPASAAWVAPTTAFDRSLFDVVAIDFLNDAGVAPSASYQAIVEALCSSVGGRVLLCAPPPTADAGLTAWSGTQTWGDNLRAGFLAAAATRGTYLYDAWDDFQRRTTGGSNTVAALMRDATHPTDTIDSAGLTAYAEAIWRAVQAPRQGAMPGNTPFVRLGAESTGSWAWTRLTAGNTSPFNDIGASVTAFNAGLSVWAMQATTTGTLTITTPACEQIGLLHLVHPTAGGEIDVSVDGGTAVRVNTTVAGAAANYGRGTFIAGGLSRATHTVTITWVSGTAAVVGVAGC